MNITLCSAFGGARLGYAIAAYFRVVSVIRCKTGYTSARGGSASNIDTEYL